MIGSARMSLLTGNPESARFYARLGYRVESEAAARRVLFGDAHAAGPHTGAGLRGALKLRFLRSRIHERGSILVRDL